MLAGWAVAAGAGDPGVSEAWRRLHRSGGRCRVGDLAGELGIGRRQLERGFREQLGISPGTIGRIARFQRAVDLIGRGASLAAAATGSGFADQSHLSRETRAMAGVTPGELRAFVQYRPAEAA
jgi:AraC-like DNA-binding protein